MRRVPVRSALALALALALFPVTATAQALDVPVRLMLFGEATFTETERDIRDGFSLGQVVGHMNASLSPRLLVFVEATVTPTDASPTATLERLILRYDFSDKLKLSVGRYHTPISWWNTAFHHGSWLQPSVARPRVVAYGTPYLPIHFNGLLAEGSFHKGPLVLAYEAGAGNGRQAPSITLPGDAGDDNGSLALVGGLRLRSTAIPGGEIGAHVHNDRIGDGLSIGERIYSGHVAFQRNVELIAEYMRITHDQEEVPGFEGDFDTNAWYVHLGYRLPPSLFGLRPYVRYEKIDTPDDGDVLFGPALAYEAKLGGIRWDFATYAALKAEYRDEEIVVAGERDDGWSLLLNASFVIPNLLGGGQPVAGGTH